MQSKFVECESNRELNSSDILSLGETSLDDSIDSGNFSGRGCLPLIRKDSITHMHGLAVYVKEGLLFTWDLSLDMFIYSVSNTDISKKCKIRFFGIVFFSKIFET